jgi:hypothetical protein
MHEVKRGDKVLAFSVMNTNLSISILIKPDMFPLLLGKDREAYENDIIGLIRAELYNQRGNI